jgi:hypothetical protein
VSSTPPKSLDLSAIKPVNVPPAAAGSASRNELYREELESYDQFSPEDARAEERQIRKAFLARELDQIDDLVKQRKIFANKIFWLLVVWLIATGAILLLQGFKFWGFQLEPKAILALIGGTTLNVIGIFAVVANFLFPKTGSPIFSKDFSKLGFPSAPGNTSASRTKRRGGVEKQP